MLIWIWTRDDGSGILDSDFRDGDINQTRPDSYEPSIGQQELKSWLVVKIPDPPNLDVLAGELETPEYAVGPTGEPVIRKIRRYRIDWRAKFTAAEQAIIADGTQTLGVVYDRFTIADVNRKN